MTIPNPVQYAASIDLSLCDLRKDSRFHDEEDIASLSRSMDKKQLQNIIVSREASLVSREASEQPRDTLHDSRFTVIVGVGRVLAARMLGWQQIRADVYEGLTEFQKLDMIFSENEDRQNASPLYQALLLKGMQEAEAEPLTQDKLAENIGKDRTTVSKYLSLLDLSPKIWANVNAFTKFGIRHFMQLLRIENKDDQWKFAEIASEKDLSSSDLGALIDRYIGVKSGAKKVGRPKGSKALGIDGFAFVQKGDRLRIRAECDLTADLDTFLSQLKAAVLTWRESHPAKVAANAQI